MTNEYDKLFKANLISFKEEYLKRKPDRDYTLFYPQVGKDYRDDSLVLLVGRAPNGWGVTWGKSDDIDKKVSESKEYSETTDPGQNCPLDWLNDDWNNKEKNYKLYRSAFWNVSYKFIQRQFEKNDSNWQNIIAWSNLMKISPAEGWNPTTPEWSWQLDTSVKLITKEIEELSPKYVLMLTGLDWSEDFTKAFQEHDDHKPYYNDTVKAVYIHHKTKIIVTDRPEGKIQEEFVKDVSDHINR